MGELYRDIADLSLLEMAPRLRIVAEKAPAYVSELETWQAKAREYGRVFARPKALDIDQRCRRDPTYFDWDLVRAATSFGFLSMLVPKGLGGGGQLSTASAIVLEELCACCSGIANIIGASNLGVSSVLIGLDFYHYDGALTDLTRSEARGEPVLFATALTEPLAGTDTEDRALLETARLMTEAKSATGGYVMNGHKVFISNGSVAKYVVVAAPLDRTRAVETESAFLLRSGTPGFTVGRVEEKMGMKACPAAELVFEDCFIPRDDLIGREGGGMSGIETLLGASRGPVGAIATGVARGALERVVSFARQKRCGGRRLIDQQWVQIRLAEMARKVHVARQAYLDSCMQFDFYGAPRLMSALPSKIFMDLIPAFVRRSGPVTAALRSARNQEMMDDMQRRRIDVDDLRRNQQYASIAKISGSDVAVDVAFEALQIAGVESSFHALELEKIYRDAKLTQIYEGTNQLNRRNLFINHFATGAPGAG
jgi:butyryl-CoA dehydrogenase